MLSGMRFFTDSGTSVPTMVLNFMHEDKRIFCYNTMDCKYTIFFKADLSMAGNYPIFVPVINIPWNN